MITKKQLKIEWYHGDERKTDFINRNHFDVTDYSRDRNAMGPGIYFTNLKYQASGYAGDSGYVYTVTVDLDPKRTLEDNTKPNKEILKKFVDRCPDEELLYNYAEDLSVARRLAVEMNMDSNLLDSIMGLYNDLYQKDAVLFAKVMTEVGYDAFYHKVNPKYPDAIHLIVYNPSIINIVKEEHKGIKESKRPMKHLKLFESFINESSVFYHGSTDKNLSGKKGIHIGTKLAATQALQARIGVPAEGSWDGTREYGKTLLAGRKRQQELNKELGYYVDTGFNVHAPDEDYFPGDRKERVTYSDGTPVPFDCKPIVFEVKIVGPMSNTINNPHADNVANGLMRRSLTKGNAKKGFFYINDGEDEGSISAVVPDKSFLKIIN